MSTFVFLVLVVFTVIAVRRLFKGGGSSGDGTWGGWGGGDGDGDGGDGGGD